MITPPLSLIGAGKRTAFDRRSHSDHHGIATGFEQQAAALLMVGRLSAEQALAYRPRLGCRGLAMHSKPSFL